MTAVQRYFPFVASLILMVFASARPAVPAPLDADMVIYNGKILTVDSPSPDNFRMAQAAAVYDGKFIAVGTNEEILPYAGTNTQKIDLGGVNAQSRRIWGRNVLVIVHAIPDADLAVLVDEHGHFLASRLHQVPGERQNQGSLPRAEKTRDHKKMHAESPPVYACIIAQPWGKGKTERDGPRRQRMEGRGVSG